MIKLKTGTFDLSGIRKSAPQETETNKHKLFNTSFEMAMRILLLTSCLPEMCFSRTRLVVLDFMSCYAKNFDLLSRNLHGDNDFMYAEMASRQSSERMNHSLSAQISYYNGLIQRNPEWEFAGVYADDGISGTTIDKRKGFQADAGGL